MKIISVAIAIAFQLSVFSLTSAAASPIGYSGMEQIDRESYLVVHDLKAHEEGNRIGILKIQKGKSPAYSPVLVNDWKHADGKASDLESVCSLPGKDAEYLLAESGDWEGMYGRIFHVKLKGETAEVLNVYHLPIFKGRTEADPDGDNYEGMVCIGRADAIFVVMGERGGSKTYRNGVLRIGVLQYNKSILSWDDYKNAAIDISAPGYWDNSNIKRSIADLHIDREGVIWAAATEDKDDDEGPFKSVIYRAALVSNQDNPIPVTPITNKQSSWVIDGFKVEALSAPAAAVKGSYMSFATEDEDYPGQWRPLFPPAK